jgi:uncharacterized CHY-type Zn-finger protein
VERRTKDLPSITVVGAIDRQTRCAHYHSPLDVVAIRMKCCGVSYACKDCHIALASHAIKPWPRREWHQPAVLCGVCQVELSINDYLRSAARCPHCSAAFNPDCRNHHHFYFESE